MSIIIKIIFIIFTIAFLGLLYYDDINKENVTNNKVEIFYEKHIAENNLDEESTTKETSRYIEIFKEPKKVPKEEQFHNEQEIKSSHEHLQSLIVEAEIIINENNLSFGGMVISEENAQKLENLNEKIQMAIEKLKELERQQ